MVKNPRNAWLKNARASFWLNESIVQDHGAPGEMSELRAKWWEAVKKI